MALEKEKASQLYGKKNEFRKDFCDLEEHELKLTAERKRESELSLYSNIFLEVLSSISCKMDHMSIHICEGQYRLFYYNFLPSPHKYGFSLKFVDEMVCLLLLFI